MKASNAAMGSVSVRGSISTPPPSRGRTRSGRIVAVNSRAMTSPKKNKRQPGNPPPYRPKGCGPHPTGPGGQKQNQKKEDQSSLPQLWRRKPTAKISVRISVMNSTSSKSKKTPSSSFYIVLPANHSKSDIQNDSRRITPKRCCICCSDVQTGGCRQSRKILWHPRHGIWDIRPETLFRCFGLPKSLSPPVFLPNPWYLPPYIE